MGEHLLPHVTVRQKHNEERRWIFKWIWHLPHIIQERTEKKIKISWAEQTVRQSMLILLLRIEIHDDLSKWQIVKSTDFYQYIYIDTYSIDRKRDSANKFSQVIFIVTCKFSILLTRFKRVEGIQCKQLSNSDKYPIDPFLRSNFSNSYKIVIMLYITTPRNIIHHVRC